MSKIAQQLNADYFDTPKGGIILNLDNAESRRTVEQCYRTHNTLINPITDWTDEDIWEFSRAENIKQSDLYVENGGTYKRLGCILCPMASQCEREKQEKDYPKFREAYIRAFDKMLRVNEHLSFKWKSGEEVYEWWLKRNTKSQNSKPNLLDFIQNNGKEYI